MTAQPDSMNDEARRSLEQRALRNVRGLVDKLESDDASRARHQKRLLVAFAAIVVLLGLAIVWLFRDKGGTMVVVEPAKPAAAQKAKAP